MFSSHVTFVYNGSDDLCTHSVVRHAHIYDVELLKTIYREYLQH